MDQKYELPQRVALALSTERLELLAGLSPDELKNEDCLQLLKDLISDRVLLRQEMNRLWETMNSAAHQTASAAIKTASLLAVLDGTPPANTDPV